MSEPEDTSQAVQDTLPGVSVAPAPRRPAAAPSQEVAAHLPVARLALDLAPPHLDRAFDYLVPAAMSDDAQPGVRVKVRFAGRDVDGYVLARTERSDHDGRLLPLRRVVSPEPVLSPAVARLARSVADHYAGTLSDVLRLAVPPRHARAEQALAAAVAAAPENDATGGTAAVGGVGAGEAPVAAPQAAGSGAASGGSVWSPYRAGAAFLAHVAGGGAPRAVWTALPGLAPPAPPDPGSGPVERGRGAGGRDGVRTPCP